VLGILNVTNELPTTKHSLNIDIEEIESVGPAKSCQHMEGSTNS